MGRLKTPERYRRYAYQPARNYYRCTVRKVREEKTTLSQADVARMLGKPRQYISQIELEDRFLTSGFACELAELFNEFLNENTRPVTIGDAVGNVLENAVVSETPAEEKEAPAAPETEKAEETPSETETAEKPETVEAEEESDKEKTSTETESEPDEASENS